MSGASFIYDALGVQKESLTSIAGKVDKTLQLGIAKVIFRTKDCSYFEVLFNKETKGKPAVLAFDKKLYRIIGMPKMGDLVFISHNNGNNAHILFVANDKDIESPPYKDKTSAFSLSIPSCKGSF